MRARILLLTGIALVVLLLVELLFDLGVVFALVFASVSILLPREGEKVPKADEGRDVLAVVMPIAGFFTAGREWRGTTIILYLVFAAVAAMAGFLGRRPALLTAAVIATMLAGLVFLRR